MTSVKNIARVFLCCAFPTLHAADLRFSGLHYMSNGEAREILGDRVELINSKPATAARASDAAFMFERLMRLQGFANASVTGSVEQGNAIRLTVHEGSRQYLGEITIEGMDAKQSRHMRRLFSSPAEKRKLAFTQQVPFLEEDVTEGMSYLIQELQSRGYWKARAELVSRSTPDGSGKVDFHIRIDQGALHTLEYPRISGNLPHYRKTLQRKLLKLQGLPATTANINMLGDHLGPLGALLFLLRLAE